MGDIVDFKRKPTPLTLVSSQQTSVSPSSDTPSDMLIAQVAQRVLQSGGQASGKSPSVFVAAMKMKLHLQGLRGQISQSLFADHITSHKNRTDDELRALVEGSDELMWNKYPAFYNALYDVVAERKYLHPNP